MNKNTKNTIDFVEIETDSMQKAIENADLDTILRLLPTYIKDVQSMLKIVRNNE